MYQAEHVVIGPVNHSCSMKDADQSLCSNRVSGHLCSCSFFGSRRRTAGRWWFAKPPINKFEGSNPAWLFLPKMADNRHPQSREDAPGNPLHVVGGGRQTLLSAQGATDVENGRMRDNTTFLKRAQPYKQLVCQELETGISGAIVAKVLN